MSTHALEQTNAAYMVKAIQRHLVGHRITQAVQDPDGGFGFTLDDGTRVWVDRDPEANGPGWLTIERGRP